MCFLSYFGFLRYDNFVTYKESYFDIFIEKSKTDCYRKGNHILISKLESNICPVKILTRYLELANIDLSSDVYIFRSLTCCKCSDKFILRKKNVCLSYTRSREIIRDALEFIGQDSAKFGTHSFRAGGATAAANNNVSDRLFKIHGRWKTELAKDGYVAENLEKRLSVSKNLGII